MKIDYYLGVINTNENQLKEQNEQIYNESKEIKELLSNLKEAINSCSFGLHQGEVKDYINSYYNEVNLTKFNLNNLKNSPFFTNLTENNENISEKELIVFDDFSQDKISSFKSKIERYFLRAKCIMDKRNNEGINLFISYKLLL